MPAIKFYNFLTRKKQLFKPMRKNRVNFYACGPTVYWYAHIGNLRTYIFEDILRRTLKYNGYKVKQVMNITDVEDKIIKKAKKEKKSIKEITESYAKIFFEDLKKLNIEKAEQYPKATKHIKEIIAITKKLLKKGFAYQGKDGSIYFNISKFKNYGRFSRLDKKKIKAGVRIQADEYNKEDAQDFVLWKAEKPGEPSWPSPFGNGRPGWHIECSAMSMKHLGGVQSQTIDMHSGAIDLLFPHHENEIAQSEAATGKKFVNYWIEGEHLLVDGQKMSKSLGNIYALRDIEKNNLSPLAFRYLVLTSHYRSKLNFTWKSLKSAQKTLDNIHEFIKNLKYRPKTTKESEIIKSYKNEFLAAVNDDLNTPKALATFWSVVKNKKISSFAKKQLLFEFDKVLGLGLNKIKKTDGKIDKIPQKIKDLAKQREKLRDNKQFIPADRLRKKIESLGYNIEDTAFGPLVRKIQ